MTVVTKPTGRRNGRPSWDLRLDRDRYLIAAFWATLIHEAGINSKVTYHAVAMAYAAMERGKLVSTRGEKLVFGTAITHAQHVAKSNGIKARADDIRRKARRAMMEFPQWTSFMFAAFTAAFYLDEERARGVTSCACNAICEGDFFKNSLEPFIIGRFDPGKRVVFSLPDFMPNFAEPKV